MTVVFSCEPRASVEAAYSLHGTSPLFWAEVIAVVGSLFGHRLQTDGKFYRPRSQGESGIYRSVLVALTYIRRESVAPPQLRVIQFACETKGKVAFSFRDGALRFPTVPVLPSGRRQ